MSKLEDYAIKGALIGLGLFVLYTAARGIKGTVADIAGGIVGGTIDAIGGAVSGAYGALPPAIRPDSQDNLIYRGVNKLVPGKNATLGTWLYDITH